MAKRLQTYTHDDLTVTFDPNRCIHAAACIRAEPDVFNSAERPWIRPERRPAADVIAAVHRCPTGALRVLMADERVDIEPSPVTVRAMRNGPLVVRGEIRIVTDDGEVLLQDTRVALCRCGQSQTKPFCDNSHRAAGFRDPA